MQNHELLLQTRIKDALKVGEKRQVDVLRLLLDAVKKSRIDSGKMADEAGFIAIVGKMLKQRRDSISHFERGGRADLVAREEEEIDLLKPFLPERLSESEVEDMIKQVISETQATGVRDMGKVMAALKPLLAGRADMSQVSRLVKGHFND